MKFKFDMNLNFSKNIKYLSLLFLVFLIFYSFIIRNIFLLNELREDVENAQNRYERLLKEEKEIEEKINILSLQENKTSSVIYKKGESYFKNTAEIIILLNDLAREYNTTILKINKSERNGEVIKISVEIEIDEENLLNFLRDIENNNYPIYIIDNDLVITKKVSDRLNLNFNILTKIENKIKDEKAFLAPKKSIKNKALFYNDTKNNSYMRIGNKIINSRDSISKKEYERRLEEENNKKKNKNKKKKSKKKEAQNGGEK